MCLPNEIGIWRYMDVARFLTLISERNVYFARLHELGDPWEGVWPKTTSDRFLFRKTTSHKHEREVRAVIYDPHDCTWVALQEANYIASHPSRRIEVGRGETVPVDLSILIERIVVSPDFPKWAVGSLQKAVNANGVNV
jgi:hypothetical protein